MNRRNKTIGNRIVFLYPFRKKRTKICLIEAENLAAVLLYSGMLQQKNIRIKLKVYTPGFWGRKLKK